MKKSVALRLIKEGDPKGAEYIIEYLARRNKTRRDSPSVYRFVRRHTGVSVDEWEALLEKVGA